MTTTVRAVPCSQFGHAPRFIIEEDDDALGESRVVTNTHHEDHKPGRVPFFINGEGAEVVISSGMGSNAAKVFSPHGRYHQRSTPCIPC